MVRLDYIWFKVSQFSLVLGRLYRRLLWQSLTTTTSLHLYNNSFQIEQFDCSWVTWLQTFPPAGWVRTVKNLRSQKAQCSTTSDSERHLFLCFFSFFFLKTTLCHSPLCLSHPRAEIQPLLQAHACTSAPSHQNLAVRLEVGRQAHHSLVLCLVVS